MSVTSYTKAKLDTLFGAKADATALATTNGNVSNNATAIGNEVTARQTLAASLPGTYAPILTPAVSGDDGPAWQAIYDAGYSKIRLQRGQTYTLNTPVFLDGVTGTIAAKGQGGFVIDLNGATVVLGDSLPQCAEWNASPDNNGLTTAQWAIFPNTKRAALSAGVVTMTGNNVRSDPAIMLRVTGPGVVTTTVGNTSSANGHNVGFIIPNSVAKVKLEGITSNCLTLLAAGSLFDLPVVENCWAVWGGSPAASLGILLWTYNASVSTSIQPAGGGDNPTLRSCGSDGFAPVMYVRGSRSVTIDGCYTGQYRLVQCIALVKNAHIEQAINASGVAVFAVDCSRVTFIGDFFQAAASANSPNTLIEINDTHPEPWRSRLLFLDGGFNINIAQNGTYYDTAVPAHITITAANLNTTVTALAAESSYKASLDGGASGPGFPIISSAVAAITTALATPQAKSCLALGTWTLRQRSGGWEVAPAGSNGLMAVRKGAAPSAVFASVAGTHTGSLAYSTQYAYAMATKDALGNYGPVAQVGHPTSPASNFAGTNRITLTVTDAPKVLCVWRQAGAAAVTAADNYVELPWHTYGGQVHDTGLNMTGVPWSTTGIPALPTTDQSQDAVCIFDPAAAGPVVYGQQWFVQRTTDGAASLDATTYINDDTLFISLPAYGTFEWEMTVLYDGSTTGDISISNVVPAGATGFAWAVGGLANSATIPNVGSTTGATRTLTSVTIFGAVGIGTTVAATMRGSITMGGTAGNFGLRYHQAALDGANPTTVKAFSCIKCRRVS